MPELGPDAGAAAAGARPPPRLAVRGVSKRFPGVVANDRVDFAVAAGRIHALLGENGAGKSTLVKMIYGLLHPDAGEILWNGEPVTIPAPRVARRLGIGMVFQHFSLFDAMSVLENVALGMDAPGDPGTLGDRIVAVSRAYGLPLDPGRYVHTLSAGERQRIEVVRCLLQDPKLLIMDEPTSVLMPQEAGRLFDTLRQLAAEGCAVLYISHKLHEIGELCGRATILRGGRVVAECDPRTETAATMARLMIGEELATVGRAAAAPAGPPRLVVDRLDARSGDAHGIDLRGISMAVRGGEVFGVAGVAGNGQTELFRALSGEVPAARDDAVRLDSVPVGRSGAGRRRQFGLCCVPEERNGHGAVAAMDLVENVVLSAHRRLALAARGFIRYGRAAGFAERVVAAFDVRTAGIRHAAGSLSGGNLQKFIVGREILQDPGVLVVAQPTWGVDAGAAAAIHRALAGLAAAGAAVVVISQDLDELMAITGRLAVIHAGRLSEALETATATVERIGLLMGGAGDAGSRARSGEPVGAA